MNFSWSSLLENIEGSNSMSKIHCLQAKWIMARVLGTLPDSAAEQGTWQREGILALRGAGIESLVQFPTSLASRCPSVTGSTADWLCTWDRAAAGTVGIQCTHTRLQSASRSWKGIVNVDCTPQKLLLGSHSHCAVITSVIYHGSCEGGSCNSGLRQSGILGGSPWHCSVNGRSLTSWMNAMEGNFLVWEGSGQPVEEQLRAARGFQIHKSRWNSQCNKTVGRYDCETVVFYENSCWSGDISVDWEKALLFSPLKSDRVKTEGAVGGSASPEPLVGSLDTSFAVCVIRDLHILLQSMSKPMKVKKVIRSSQMDFLSANHDWQMWLSSVWKWVIMQIKEEQWM